MKEIAYLNMEQGRGRVKGEGEERERGGLRRPDLLATGWESRVMQELETWRARNGQDF